MTPAQKTAVLSIEKKISKSPHVSFSLLSELSFFRVPDTRVTEFQEEEE
jgi:hypothetical protein